MASSNSSASPSAAQPARRRGPGRPKAGSEDKRERVLKEAVALFGAHGYAGTSLADIAAAADISKAGLLHHFSSKDELFAQVLARRDREDVNAIAELAGDDPWAMLDAYVRLVERNAQRRDLVAIYTATVVSVLDAEHPAHEWFVEHLHGSLQALIDAFEKGKDAGVVRPEAPSALIARSLTALSDGLQIQWLASTTSGSVADESLATDMVAEIRLYIDGLKERWGVSA
ncbi:TetR/AcrR family transcriptional regulator [Actinomyces radicidentis]|uniref:TetR/AcrR family transcriptional regulator n=1 Tax=Actinomyces radicidentis TaxID=111015 RepID=UPI0026E05966|nr:TetR/AcrR family transcriptional regulator [Actinomyces radicidentis]